MASVISFVRMGVVVVRDVMELCIRMKTGLTVEFCGDDVETSEYGDDVTE